MSSSLSPLQNAERHDSLLPLIRELCDHADWCIEPGPDWIALRHCQEVFPAQGWKLHVSAAAPSAHDVLRRALPILLAENARFKVAASLRALNGLNEGRAKLSQVGKFLTVYPTDDVQAVRLAVALDAATRGLRGPAVPSDRPLAPGSLVHYRYGGFTPRTLQTPLGEVLPALAAPDGTLVPDARDPFFSSPGWAVDPFLAAGVTAPPPPKCPLVGGRYLVAETLHRTARGAVFAAFDLDDARRCVLKQGLRDATLGADGADSRDRLRHEAAVLRSLASDARFPAVFDLFESEGDLYLALEEVAGETLDRHVARDKRQGRFASDAQIAAWGREMASLLQAVHDAGWIYRDVKAANVVLAPDGHLRLLDFELAHAPASDDRPRGYGTRGYMSPAQAAGAPPAPGDDVYGLGALLFFAATGADPSQSPHPFALLGRPIRLLNPAIGPALAAAIARCLDSANGFASACEAEEAFATLDAGRSPARELTPPAEEDFSSRARAQAQRLGDTLCATARPAPNGRGLLWICSSPDAHRNAPSRDLNLGSGGGTLALAEIAACLGVPEHRQALSEAARWLVESPRPAERPLAGLYVGEAGAGAALLRAGQVLGRADLIAEAARVGAWVAAQPFASPDLFNGTAGRLRFHLWLWDETGDPAALHAAIAAGQVLCRAALEDEQGQICWPVPPGYRSLSEAPSLGYAHGAAGIADVLLDLAEATGDDRYLGPVRGAARWLARLATPALGDGSGLNWPPVAGAPPFPAFWCHGAAGIGQFFLHAARLDALPEAADLAARAACSVTGGVRWSAPAQCHGLAGGIEFLLDMFQATHDHAYLTDARALASLLDAFATEQEGRLVWPSDSAALFSPDYMAGYAGVAVCLLRLADPERLPRQLSRAGFRAAPSPPSSGTPPPSERERGR